MKELCPLCSIFPQIFLTLNIVLSNMKKEEILHHTTAQLHDCGYICRIVNPDFASPERVSYTNRDDYYMLGFTDNTYFTRLFTNTVGVPPNKFRDSIN